MTVQYVHSFYLDNAECFLTLLVVMPTLALLTIDISCPEVDLVSKITN